MKNSFFKFSIVVLLMAASCGCSSNQNGSVSKVGDSEPLQMVEIEPAIGKLNVYTSMARSVKYNVDSMAKNIHSKVKSGAMGGNPKETIRQVLNIKSGASNQLYDAVRVLDFSVIYAMSNLSASQLYVEQNIYSKSAAQLAMAAIKSHKDTLFSLKKLKEIDRLMVKENKELKALNSKLSRNGMLSENDLELKKGIEVGLFKLQKLKEFLSSGVVEYGNLTKTDVDKIALEGRRFYELEDFDKKNTINTFQNMAVGSRSEFAMMKNEGYSYSASEVKQNAIRFYPEIEALDLNGYNVKDGLYLENLEHRAIKIADNLIDAVIAYQKAEKQEQKPALLKAAFEQLGVAVVAQIELNYNIVHLADLDYLAVQEKVSNQRKEIKSLAFGHNLSAAQKIQLFNKKIEMFELELRKSQIMAERAVALRGLYFNAGLSPFNKKLMEAKIGGIEESLKISFNKDMIEMLAQVQKQQQSKIHPDNQWAKQDNWLEKLIDEKPVAPEKPIVIPQKPEGEFDPYIGNHYDKMKIMQLGSYRERQNADLEWKMLKELYPLFENYKPRVESTLVNGRRIYRLVIKSGDGGLKDICNQLRMDRVECILH